MKTCITVILKQRSRILVRKKGVGWEFINGETISQETTGNAIFRVWFENTKSLLPTRLSSRIVNLGVVESCIVYYVNDVKFNVKMDEKLVKWVKISDVQETAPEHYSLIQKRIERSYVQDTHLPKR